jgi:hypothetical protein
VTLFPYTTLFRSGQEEPTIVPAGETRSLFSIRLAPSVDNGVGAIFGAREIINRMQLITQELDVTLGGTVGNVLVTAVLNGVPTTNGIWLSSSTSEGKIATSSLAQVVDYSSTATATVGGEKVAGFFVNSNSQTLNLSGLRDLGNSILGGGTEDTDSHIYPDGPDVLTINVTNLDASDSVEVLGRLTWTEAQA